MKNLLLLAFLLLFSCSLFAQGRRLWYDEPAQEWESELPLGNGRLGFTVAGEPVYEIIPLSDIGLWSGSNDSLAFEAEANAYLPQIREALLRGDNHAAQDLMYAHFKCGGLGSAHGAGAAAPYGSFQMLGSLEIRHLLPKGPITEYRRELLLGSALAHTSFRIDTVHYTRSYFSSQGEEDVIVMRFSADHRGRISFSAKLTRPENGTASVRNGHLRLEGRLPDGFVGEKGVRYAAEVSIIPTGGSLRVRGDSVIVEQADAVLLLVAAGTDNTPPGSRDPKDPGEQLASLESSDYESLLRSHLSRYRSLYDRVELSLGDSIGRAKAEELTTDGLLEAFHNNGYPDPSALYFDFGRYLILSATRPGSWPMNLQGLWTNSIQAPWNGDYHLNVNLEMNYWPVEPLNLPEYHTPLLRFVSDLVPSGRKTARTFYGADGWVAHMMTNPWHFTAPGEEASWGATNTGGAWLALHGWEHFLFTRDTVELRRSYPVMLEAGKFFLSSMITEPEHGYLVTAPSSSPENGFYLEGSDEPVYVVMGPTMDSQIIRRLFNAVLDAAGVLGTYDPALTRMANALPLLPPNQVSEKGYLLEWLKDYREVDPRHRHVSHLFALYPGAEITPQGTPDLARAARLTLERRGDEGTGWSMAWKVLFWSRLGEGERAYSLLRNLLKPAIRDPDRSALGSGTYPNLFCAHPPFQIDGNLGATAGIAEMLLQSHQGFVELLPAIPAEWTSQGSFSGLKARGNIRVSAEWRDGRVTRALFETDLPEAEFSLKDSRGTLRHYTLQRGTPLTLTDL